MSCFSRNSHFWGRGVVNLIAQTLPVFACIFVRRPVWRAVFGTFFVVETLALGLVMDLWNLQWLPLAAVFVDWDAVIARIPTRPWATVSAPAAAPDAAAGARHRVASAFIVAFVAYDLGTAFVPRLDQRLNTYPFSSFPMFASIRARRPYDQHQPYSFASGYFEIVSKEPVPDHVYRWIDHAYRKTFTVRNRDELRERLTAILADAQRWHPPIQGLRCHYAIYEAAAYPAPAKLERHPVGLLGEVFLDGTFRSMLGTVRPDGPDVVLLPGETQQAIEAVESYADEQLPPTRIVLAPAASWRVPRPKAKKVAYVVVARAAEGEQRWLVATTPR